MKTRLMSYQPLMIFWLGLLTGALIVSLFLLNNLWKSQDGTAAVLTPTTLQRTITTPTATTQSAATQLNSSSWIKILDPTPWMPR
ncbi:MAG: hypothetical protein UT33_C0007G0011 [Candidatus Peregrinibacteria bacterium GW2011_GWC2_39_14]|nr:MAG: hypothetical protein US92_C0002G0012 [Candidatus Peregrinibacteria bacterium GW2011_GWA2_38_36]KKR06823.1 MAG: hypothetical protein UT33_C0007G0011 [Candidatus Peregrinibacteria bacterium GW2011_GWC2_39_14]